MGSGLIAYIADGIGVLVLLMLLALLGFGVVTMRRGLLARRGGTVELSMRLRPRRTGGAGWAAGVARFTVDELQWFRLFSLSPRPRARLPRGNLSIASRRPPRADETASLHPGTVVLQCHAPQLDDREIAMSEATLAGFQSWLEAQPPGRSHEQKSSNHSAP